MKRTRIFLCSVLGFGLAGHLLGTFLGYEIGSEMFVWSLSGAAFVGSVIALNLPAALPEPRLLWTGGVAALVWAALALAFGAAIGNVLDPRVLIHALAALGLAILNARELVGARVTKRAAA